MLPAQTQLHDGAALQAWWVVDVARHPYLQQSIYMHEANPDFHSLYLRTPLSSLLEYSPILLRPTAGSSLWSMLEQPLWQQNALVVWTKEQEETGLLEHLQSLLFMEVERNLTLVRFYSPATFHALSKSLTPSRLALMAGPIMGWDYCVSGHWLHIPIEREYPPISGHKEGWFTLSADEMNSFNLAFSRD